MKDKRRTILFAVAALLLVVASTAAVYALKCRRDRIEASRIVCMTNMKWIEITKRIWATDHGVTNNGAGFTVTDLQSSFEGGDVSGCEGGGKYTMGNIGEWPRCSVHGCLSENSPFYDWNKERQIMQRPPTKQSSLPRVTLGK